MREITHTERKKKVARYHMHLLELTRLKTTFWGTKDFPYLAGLLKQYLYSNNNLAVTVRYQK